MKTIERLRELEKAATPVYAHPTELEHDTADGKCGDVRIWERDIPGVCVAVFKNRKARATAEHYIATRNALPALLAVVEAAEELKVWTVPGDGIRETELASDSFANAALDGLLDALRALNGETT